MKPAPFIYHAPDTLDEALSCLNQYGNEAKILAGGQSLVPTMNFRLAQPAVLVDLNRIKELFYITGKKGGIKIGAMTRQRELERSELISAHTPLISEAMPHVAHPQIRNRGTAGGSIAHGDPAAELPALMTALNARFLARSQKQKRWVSAEEFYTGMFSTALEPEELLAEIEIPALPRRSGWAFREIASRHGDYALVGVAAVVELDRKGRCSEARIVFLSVGDRPVRAVTAAQRLAGETPGQKHIAEAARIAAEEDINPGDDLHASAAYRRRLAKVLTVEVLEQAFARAQNT